MNITSWGNYKTIDAKIVEPRTYTELWSLLLSNKNYIPRGEGKSYGDSALNECVIKGAGLNHLLEFDKERGILRCQSGVTLERILDEFVPRGWFIYSSPGTKLISVGGAVASDVHGKSHHKEGSFSDHLHSFKIMLPTGEMINCSRDQNPGLFKATCGGMGLTGFITEVTLQLKPISSSRLNVKTVASRGLSQVMELFDEYEKWDYSVAWLDCIGREPADIPSIFTVGQFSETGSLNVHKKQKWAVPFNMPDWTLNPYTARLFNCAYYWLNRLGGEEKEVHYDSFFYPLDSIGKWNRLYGKSGFTQYQFVVPQENSFRTIRDVLNIIQRSDQESYLAVLKKFGEGNDNFLSFPQMGFSLALDFQINSQLFDLLNKLDTLITERGGRIYLTKDAHISEDIFKKGYPRHKDFLKVLESYDIRGQIGSLQSKRIGLT